MATTRSLRWQQLQLHTTPFSACNRMPQACFYARPHLAHIQQRGAKWQAAGSQATRTKPRGEGGRIGMKSAHSPSNKRAKAPTRAKQYFGDNTVVPQMTQEELSNVFSQELFIYRCDVTAGHIDSAMRAFGRLLDLNVLTSEDIAHLAKQLHHAHRVSKDRDAILPHMRMLIHALQTKRAPWTPLAAVHILTFLKDVEEFTVANAFWTWLYAQDESICDARTIGAALELLCAQGESLENLERLYEAALTRFSYREDSGGGTHHKPTRMMLLQGIIHARLHSGEWRSAYDALDTCLRLHPTMTPSRIYELFIYQRPPVEGYLIFLAACRAGCVLNPALLTSLTREYERETHDPVGVLQMIYSYIGCRGSIDTAHLNSLVQALLTSAPVPTSSTPSAEEIERLASVFRSVQQTTAAFQAAGTSPTPATYNTLISHGARLRNSAMVHEGLASMLRAKCEPTPVTYRVLINAFGQLGEAAQVRESWFTLVDLYSSLSRRPIKPPTLQDIATGTSWRPKASLTKIPLDFKDWIALAKACIATNQEPFLYSQMSEYDATIDLTSKRALHHAIKSAKLELRSPPRRTSTPATSTSTTHISTDAYQTALRRFKSITSVPTLHDFTTTPPTFPPGASPLPHKNLKAAYDFFTTKLLKNSVITNSSNPKVDDLDPQQRTATGYTIGELRFENWMTVNHLLFLAEQREKAQIEAFVAGRNVEAGKGVSGAEVALGNEEERIKKVQEKLAEAERKKRAGELSVDELVALRASLVGGDGVDVRGERGEMVFNGGGEQGGREIAS